MNKIRNKMALLLAAMLACAALFACTPKAEAPVEESPAAMAGAYSFEQAVPGVLPEEAKDAFDAAMAGYTGMNLEPIALVGTQVVAGTNYAILCKGTRVTQNPVSMMVIAIIYQDLEGKASVRNVADFDIVTLLEEADGSVPAADDVAGGWAVPEAEAAPLPEELQTVFDKALEGFVGAGYRPLGYLGSQVVAGRNHVYVCASTLVTATPISMVSLVKVYEDLDGNCTITAIAPISVADYND